ncbi:MAG: CPBP family intramembrane metalloprotease [Clostridia bacterium]|nr:CPBP family intramembrane metalloprotease [Clostridia bacterium]
MKIKGIHAAPALIIFIMALTCAAGFVDIKSISGASNPMLTITVLQLVIIGIPSVFFCLLRGHDYSKKLRLRFIPARHVTMTVYSLVFTVFGSMALSLMMYRLFPDAYDTGNAFVSYTAVETGGAIYAAVTLALVPAILEEFLFRGIISAEYSTYGAATSIIMSSVMFAMLHMSFVKLPIYLFTGVILALTAAVSDSIISSMLVHGLNNIFVLFLEPYLYKIAAKSDSGLALMMFMVTALMLLFAVLFFMKAERLYGDRAYANEDAPLIRKRKDNEYPHMVQALISPTFIILAVFFVVLTVVS